MITKIEGKCQQDGCDQPATHIAAANHYDAQRTRVGLFCETHAEMVSDSTNPEYKEFCPNCGCLFGVN